MNDGFLKSGVILKLFKNKAKLFFVLGILGVVLIFLSSFFETSTKNENSKNDDSVITSNEYCEQLERKVKQIVTSITGSKNCVVVVTLDTSVQYIYADNKKQQTSNSEQNDKKENSNSNEQNYIIITDSGGDESPIVITEYMPNVRGVAIVCEGGYDQIVIDKIKNAVMSALNITSKRIYVTGR